MNERVLLGYTGSWAGHLGWAYERNDLKEKLKKDPKNAKLKAKLKALEKDEPKAWPVYISKAKQRKLKEFEELEYLSGFH